MSDLHGTRLKPALLRRLHAPLIDRYVAVSHHLEHFLEEQIGVRAERIRQIYNGVDTRRFSPRHAGPAIALPEGVRGEGIVVAGAGGRPQPPQDHGRPPRPPAPPPSHEATAPRPPPPAPLGDGPRRPHPARP